MQGLVHDIFHVDWDQVQLTRAASGLVSMLVVVGFIGLIGDVAMAALFATLFVTAAGGDGEMSERLPGMVRFTIIGAIFGALAYWSVESVLTVALVLGTATYLGTLGAADGPNAARAGMYLTFWPLFALLLGSTDTEPWTVAVGFLAGGTLAIALTAARLRVSPPENSAPVDHSDAVDDSPETATTFAQRLVDAARSPMGGFALLRAIAVVAAVVLGFWLFSSYPLWVAITVIVVIKPSAHQSLSAAIERTLGTGVGVGVAVLIAQILPRSETGVVVAFLLSGALMIAFNNANYTLFATFLTSMLVFGQRLVQEDAFEAGWERLLATAVGAALAIAVVSIAVRLRPMVQGPSTNAPA